MARIGRSADASQKEVRVANWFAMEGFPAVRLAADISQPVPAAGFSVTFWEFIHETLPLPTARDLGRILRDLHSLATPPELDLPEFQALPKVPGRLRNLPSGSIGSDDLEFLWRRCAVLDEQFGKLDFELPRGPIHGDAHNGNLMRDREGTVRLIDFEDFAWGPREWDVSVVTTRFQAFGWMSRYEYEEYVDVYGFDPLKWSGYPVLRAVRELNMTTWLMQQIGQSSTIDQEVRKRLADLRNDQFPRDWRVF
jgi:aminoglycoside phosphotransferase (APT) family kinase protein